MKRFQVMSNTSTNVWGIESFKDNAGEKRNITCRWNDIRVSVPIHNDVKGIDKIEQFEDKEVRVIYYKNVHDKKFPLIGITDNPKKFDKITFMSHICGEDECIISAEFVNCQSVIHYLDKERKALIGCFIKTVGTDDRTEPVLIRMKIGNTKTNELSCVVYNFGLGQINDEINRDIIVNPKMTQLKTEFISIPRVLCDEIVKNNDIKKQDAVVEPAQKPNNRNNYQNKKPQYTQRPLEGGPVKTFNNKPNNNNNKALNKNRNRASK